MICENFMNELDDISLQFSLINQSHAAAKTNRTSIKCFELCHKKGFHVFYGQNVLFLPIKLLNMRNFNTGIYQNTFPDIQTIIITAKLARNKLKLRKDIVKKM